MISVVTITFNNFEELMATVNSVKGLTGIEHIIINGGSCERTREFLSNFTGKSVSEPDQGISDAFNKGIKLSTGKGIIFLNSGDVLIEPKYLAWADEQLDLVDFTYSDINFNDPIAGLLRIRPHGQDLGRGMPFPHQTMIVRKKAFEELGPFKLNYKRAMCFEFTCRLLKAAKTSDYYPEPTMLMDGSGISSTQEAYTLLESKQGMIENGIYDIRNQLLFAVRTFGYKARMALIALKLKPLLRQLKKLKRSLS